MWSLERDEGPVVRLRGSQHARWHWHGRGTASLSTGCTKHLRLNLKVDGLARPRSSTIRPRPKMHPPHLFPVGCRVGVEWGREGDGVGRDGLGVGQGTTRDNTMLLYN